MIPSVPDFSKPWQLYRGLLWAQCADTHARCVFARHRGSWRLMMVHAVDLAYENDWWYLYGYVIAHGYQSVDGIPWEIHAIGSRLARHSATKAFLESAGRVNEQPFDPSTLP